MFWIIFLNLRRSDIFLNANFSIIDWSLIESLILIFIVFWKFLNLRRNDISNNFFPRLIFELQMKFDRNFEFNLYGGNIVSENF